MAAGSAISPTFREGLVISEGSAIMLELFGKWTWLFLVGVGSLLLTLAFGSWRRRRWAWPLTLFAYGFGVIGSLWEVAIGIWQGWISAAINGAVVSYTSTPGVRRAYGWIAQEAADDEVNPTAARRRFRAGAPRSRPPRQE